MVAKRSKQNPGSKRAEKKGRVKLGKLKLNKETVKNLTNDEAKQVKGGLGNISDVCRTVGCNPSIICIGK